MQNASLATAVPIAPAINGENYFGAAFQELG